MVWRKLRRNKTVPRNYLDLWKKESGFARDAPSSDSLWRAERFCEVSGEDRICRSGGEICSHPIALSQRHRSGGDLHGLFDLGGERGTALCAHRTAAGRSRVAPPAGDRAFPNRCYDPESVQAIHAREGVSVLFGLNPMADPTLAPPRRGLQFGFGFHRLRTVWSAAGSLERAEPAQARAALASSVASGFGRSTLHSARLAAQWELWHGSRGGGISEGGAGLSTRVARGAAGAGRCGVF